MTITFADNSALTVGFEVPLEMLAAFHLRVQDQCSTLLRLASHREWLSRCPSRWPGNARAERTQPIDRPCDFLDDSRPVLAQPAAQGHDAAASHKLNLNQGHKWASDEALRKGTESVTTDEVIARTATR